MSSLSEKHEDGAGERFVAGYHQAFTVYLDREFEKAAAVLESQRDGMPSRVLLERCLAYQQNSPPKE